MARIHYLRIADKIPSTLEGQAAYWKKYYNSEKGAGTVEEYIANYKKYNGIVDANTASAAVVSIKKTRNKQHSMEGKQCLDIQR